MKKILAVLLAAACLLSVTVLPTAADIDYIEIFEGLVNSIRFSNKTPSGQAVNAQTVYNYTVYTLCGDDTYATIKDENGWGLEYVIPAADFEDYATGMFVIDDTILQEIRQLTYAAYNSETQTTAPAVCYDEATNSYKAGFQGGFGDPSRYVCQGYKTVDTDKYEAYLTLYDDSSDEPRIVHHVKWLFEYTGEAFRYISWAQIDAIPEGLITPSTGTTTTTTTQESTTTTTASTTTTKPITTTTGRPITTTTRRTTATTRPTVKIDEELTVLYKTESLLLQAAKDTFAENTRIAVTELYEGDTFDRVSEVLEETALKFVAYDITATLDGAKVQPSGKVEATFTIPEGWNLEALKVVYIADDFSVETLDCTIDTETYTALVTLNHFSTYALIQQVDKLAGPTDNGAPIGAILALIAGILALVGLAVYTILLIRNQKAAVAAASATPVAPADAEPVLEDITEPTDTPTEPEE